MSFFYGALHLYLPSSHQLMLLPTQLLRQGDRSPVSFAVQKFRLQIPLRPCITPIEIFASQAQQLRLPEETNTNLPGANSLNNAPTVPALSTAGAAGLVGRENPPRVFPEQGWISLCLWELLWDGERCTWKRSMDRSSSWKAHLSCQ